MSPPQLGSCIFAIMEASSRKMLVYIERIILIIFIFIFIIYAFYTAPADLLAQDTAIAS
jgi:hypothetical protein